jgi:adenylate cyclase, class 2
VVVDKKREIYFIDNVKFHIDDVKDLGSFVEIEAQDMDGSLGSEKITQQCKNYIKLFNIVDADMVSGSYSDLLIRK